VPGLESADLCLIKNTDQYIGLQGAKELAANNYIFLLGREIFENDSTLPIRHVFIHTCWALKIRYISYTCLIKPV
jgi:hypothetical protein